MGKVVALALAAFMIAGTVYTQSTKESQLRTSREISSYQTEVLARNAALAGYNMARTKLAEGMQSRKMSGSTDMGNYAVSIDVEGNLATIEVLGYTDGPNSKPLEHGITAVYRKSSADDQALTVPPFLKPMVMSGKNLQIRGTPDINILGTPEERARLNANIHTNANLIIRGNSAHVSGFGTYAGGGTGKLDQTFRPNYNPDDMPSHSQVPPIELPGIDLADMASKVTVDQYTPSNVTLSGTYDFGGTREDPYYYHVKGNLRTTGNTRVDGYTVFIVDGEIELGGNVAMGMAETNGEHESTTAFYSTGDVTLAGGAQVNGQIYTAGSVVQAGLCDVYGNVITHEFLELLGTTGIHYRPASPALTALWSQEDGSERLELVSYFER